MKILKIVLILLVPALGIVSCKKSGIKPGCPEHTATEQKSNTASDSNTSGDRIINSEELLDNGNGTNVIGSGDDDRDGGDKKKKTVK